MKLEDLLKYYFLKFFGLIDVLVLMLKDVLSIIDVMVVQGMIQNWVEMGFFVFFGKMGISMNDREWVIELLIEYVFSWCDCVVVLRKFLVEIKLVVMCIMVLYVFEDYVCSVVSKKQCFCCYGKKFIESEVFINKIQYSDGKLLVWVKCMKGVYLFYWEEWKKVREVVKVVCSECGGKGEVFIVCKDCCGCGVVIYCEELVKCGMFVIRDCQCCGGCGCERLLLMEVFNVICKVMSVIMFDMWKKLVKCFYDMLVVWFDIEEVWVEWQLKRVM